MPKPELELPRASQIAVLRDIAERCDDIVDDVKQIEGWERDGRLLGILAVAEAQIPRLQNIADNLEFCEK
jgi:hypothetical protein